MRMVQCKFRRWVIPVLLAVYCVLPATATFPGVNGRISFARFFPATQSESIFSIRPDGGGEQQLTFDAINHFSEVSDWSPDGLRIAFHSDRNSTDSEFVIDIFTMKADGSNVLQLTRHAGQNVAPEYSPSGSTIVFDREGLPGVEGIYIMNANDGGNMRRVTAAPAGTFDFQPHFSPDGNRIVFSRGLCIRGHAGCLAAVFIVNVDGSGLTQITPPGLDMHATDWSPDGTKIALESAFDKELPGSKNDVYVLNVDGSGLVNLTNNAPSFTGKAGEPCSRSGHAKWSPDGMQLVFWQGDCLGNPAIWIMNSDGSNKHRLVGDINSEGFPDWGSNQD
jgi:TolB protein